MRISKTSGRSTPKMAKKPARSASQSKARAKSKPRAQAQALDHTPSPGQLSGLKLAMQRLADGVSKLQAAPLSGTTAQEALAGLRGE